jgi:hypothetical protein
VGWVNTSKYDVRDAFEPYAPLLKPGAKEEFERVYRNMGLPIVVVLDRERDGMGRLRGDDHYVSTLHHAPNFADLAREKNAIVLLLSPQKRGPRSFYKELGQARGEETRLTPYTPFNLLHRLADERFLYYDGQTPQLKAMLREMSDAANAWGRPVRGVNTAAGRLGVLSRGEEIPELFAKYALTGKIDFHPPPTQDGDEARYNEVLLRTLPFIFPGFMQFLRDEVPTVVPIDFPPYFDESDEQE